MATAVVDVFGPDPFVDRQLRELLGRGVSPLRREWRLAEQRVLLDRVDVLDTDLAELTMERRWIVGRLERMRDEQWPLAARLRRRRPRFDLPPVPPLVPDSQPLHGEELRATCLVILSRHGPMGLRDLDGYLHRYGYHVGGKRPVQRLGDCMAYEVRAERARRLARGQYAAEPGLIGVGRLADRSPEDWSETPGDGPSGPPVDPVSRELPERWQPWPWPARDVDPPDDLRPDIRDEVLAVFESYVTARRREFVERHGHRNPRAFIPASFGDDSSAIRPGSPGGGRVGAERRRRKSEPPDPPYGGAGGRPGRF